MGHMYFRSFVWPENPEHYQEHNTRTANYRTADGVTYYAGMSEMKRGITGSGTFYGEQAWELFQKLQLLMEEGVAGTLYHPVLGNRHCYFTGLELIQEPRENAVGYRFEFTQALANGEVPR